MLTAGKVSNVGCLSARWDVSARYRILLACASWFLLKLVSVLLSLRIGAAGPGSSVGRALDSVW